MQEGANFMSVANVRFELRSIKARNKGLVLHLQLPPIIWSMQKAQIWALCIEHGLPLCACVWMLNQYISDFFPFKSGRLSKQSFVLRNIAAQSDFLKIL